MTSFSICITIWGEDTCLYLFNHAGVKLSYQSHERGNIPLLQLRNQLVFAFKLQALHSIRHFVDLLGS